MIFEPRKFSFVLQDALYSLAVGLVCGFINRLLSCFLYKGRRRLFVKDIMTGFVFALLSFSYAVSFANYKVLRWYNIFFALAGMLSFRPGFDRVVRLLSSLVLVTAGFFLKKSANAAITAIAGFKRKKVVKYQKNTQNLQSVPLQDDDKVLYN